MVILFAFKVFSIIIMILDAKLREKELRKEEDKIDFKELEKTHKANKKQFDRKGHLSNTETLVEKSKAK